MNQDEMKQAVGRAAVDHVKDGMRLGIGTGSTAEAFVHALAEAVGEGLSIVGVPTSERTAGLCVELGIALTTLDEVPNLDLTIDGADELDADLNLIKGGGGALLREKIVATASKEMLVIADASKTVQSLGAYPLPIEINPFGAQTTTNAVARVCEAFGGVETLTLRADRDEEPYVTDGGHYILDAAFGHISDPKGLEQALLGIAGVVQTGLFIGIAKRALIATPDGIQTLHAPSGA